jgi:hypothetical protein
MVAPEVADRCISVRGIRGRPVLFVSLALLCALVAAAPGYARAGKPLPAPTPVRADALTRALARGQLTEAQYTLQRARSLFRLGAVRQRYGDVARPDPHAATFILRDLSLRLRELSGADRRQAMALLARPTDNPNSDDPGNSYGSTAEATPACGANVCVHYVTTGGNAVSTTDTNGGGNGIPDYVDQVLDVLQNQIWVTEVTNMGYRAPKSDTLSTNNGANLNDLTGSKFDVYLANVGDDGFYGYCISDDPNLAGPPLYSNYDMSAYCVLDNNYTEPVFTGQPPLANLEVTAAHEFFHAVQAAYDWFEDRWLMEATAVWMEDELYTDINDNLQYLADSPLTRPGVPLDKGPDPCCHVYGAWIFFRFLSEWFGPSAGVEDQSIVRQIWDRADGSPAGPDDDSILAIRNVAVARGTDFRKLFGTFGWINRISRTWYDEGTANAYPQSPLAASPMTLSRLRPSRSLAPKLNHQTNRYYEFKRGTGAAATARLKFVLDLPSLSFGSYASALVFKKTGGAPTMYRFSLSGLGNGTFRVPFGSGIARVDLVLTNASTRYNCWTGAEWACMGTPLDNARTFKVTARLS